MFPFDSFLNIKKRTIEIQRRATVRINLKKKREEEIERGICEEHLVYSWARRVERKTKSTLITQFITLQDSTFPWIYTHHRLNQAWLYVTYCEACLLCHRIHVNAFICVYTCSYAHAHPVVSRLYNLVCLLIKSFQEHIYTGKCRMLLYIVCWFNLPTVFKQIMSFTQIYIYVLNWKKNDEKKK